MNSILDFVESNEAGHSESVLYTSVRFLFVIIFQIVIISLTFASQPCQAEPTVEEMIAEYHQVKDDLQRVNEISENQKNYPRPEVEKAIQERELLGRRLQVLKNEINLRGGTIKEKNKTPEKNQPGLEEESQTDSDAKPDNDELLTPRQKSDIKKEEYRIKTNREKLDKYDPESKMATILKKSIQRSEDRIRKIRDSVKQTINVSPDSDGRISAEYEGISVAAKLPKVRRPWVLGDWPWDFHHPRKNFKMLKEKYYRLQAEMGAVLLTVRDEWSYKQATRYNGRLSILCKLIIDTEEDLAFGLGNATKFERATRQHKWKWQSYLRKQKITDDAEKKMNNTAAEFYQLLKKSGLKPGDQISKDDPNANQLAYLQRKHEDEQKDFIAKQIVSEIAKYESGPVSDAIKQRIEDGIALTRQKPPVLYIHRGCGGSQSSFVYEMFLSEDEFQTFLNQGLLRMKVTQR